jgi:putative ABC transport system substrate-binding protein
MKRRQFIALLGGAVAAGSVFWPFVARAEASSKRPTIAWIAPGTREVGASFIESFLRGMREFGHVEGRSFDMVYRFADGYQERLPALTEEVVRLKPDVILASAVAATVAARKATSTIPIVTPADAVHLGLIGSEARPGGNVYYPQNRSSLQWRRLSSSAQNRRKVCNVQAKPPVYLVTENRCHKSRCLPQVCC